MKTLFSIIVAFFCILSCAGQTVGQRIIQNSVVLYNSSPKVISFLLGEDSLRMDTFKIRGNDVWFSPDYQTKPVIFIQTGTHVARYRLTPGNYYMIFFNSKKKYWDIKKTQKRQ